MTIMSKGSEGIDHERLVIRQDAETGLRMVIAVHSNVLGPALGGMRLRAYPGDLAEALDDVLKLARTMTLKALEEGLIDIIVGTHAIFSEDVRFRDLGLAVVDEQHRFGVHQRMQLQGKGERPADVLVMTAKPIPRTLQLTAYGDMDVSRLTGKPPGRWPVETRVLPASRLDEVIEALKRALAKGARAYWVCPLVEESEKIDLAAAAERATMLRAALGEKIGLVHGRMKGPERDEVVAQFKGANQKRGDSLIAFGWAMAEYLAKLG